MKNSFSNVRFPILIGQTFTLLNKNFIFLTSSLMLKEWKIQKKMNIKCKLFYDLTLKIRITPLQFDAKMYMGQTIDL